MQILESIRSLSHSSGTASVTGAVRATRNPTGTVDRLRLPCNGANYSQSQYSGLYQKIGGAYSRSTNVHVNGKPWKNRFLDMNAGTSTLGSWTTGTSLPGALNYSQAIVTKSRVYLLGGYNGSSYIATVYTAPINSDGTLGSWTTGTSLPDSIGRSQPIMTKDRVYLLGGWNSSIVSTVYTAPINSDGTLGTWTTGTSLPAGWTSSQAIVTNSRVYLLGGYNGSSYTATVYTAPINSDGTLGTWTTGTSVPDSIGRSQSIMTKDRVYLLGGYNGSPVSTVYTAPINSDGTLGTWTTGTSLPGALCNSQAIVTNSRVYLLGGENGSPVSTVYTAPINSDGTLGTWTTGTSLPGGLTSTQVIVTNGHVYLLGGNNGSVTSTVYTATISNLGANDYLTGTTLECYLPATGGSEFAVPRYPYEYTLDGGRMPVYIDE